MADLQLVGAIEWGAASPSEPFTVRFSAQNEGQERVPRHQDYVALVDQATGGVFNAFYSAPEVEPSGLYVAEVPIPDVPSGHYMVYVYLDHEHHGDLNVHQTGPVWVFGALFRMQEPPAPLGPVVENQPFQIAYSVVNDGQGASAVGGHKDYIAIYNRDTDANVYENWYEQAQVPSRGGYGVYLDVPGVPAGNYVISVSAAVDPQSGESQDSAGADFTVAPATVEV